MFPNLISFLSSLMCRPWGIRLKWECNEVYINRIYLSIDGEALPASSFDSLVARFIDNDFPAYKPPN
jgi:hypothetical protein